MIPVIEVFDDVLKDSINSSENGDFSIATFNRMSRRAELRMMDYLTGDVENLKAPEIGASQKNRDWISPFVVQLPVNISNGQIDRPENYYGWDNAYRISGYNKVDCDTNETQFVKGCDIPIEILEPQAFKNRCNSFIKSLKPSFSKPICKIVGRKIYIEPYDLGSLCIEYIRYPKFAKIIAKKDDVYNDEIPDVSSLNYEWDENARELLIYFITDTFANKTREGAIKQMNQETGKLIRDQKR